MPQSKLSQSTKRLPITVAIVVRNDGELLRRALQSVADIVDEIVIVHDGPCTDNTLEIARSFGAKVFVRKWAGAPEPHRPFSFEQAKNAWILQMDADEYLEENFRQALPHMIKRNVSGYKVNWVEDSSGERFINMCKEVLFQKDRVYFLGVPNEYVKPVKSNDELVTEHVDLVNSAKTGNYESWKFYTAKYEKFAKIQARLYSDDFSKIAKWNYHSQSWDARMKAKIDHPILLGILGMNTKYVVELVKLAVGMHSDVSAAAALHLMWYNTVLFWNVAKNTRRI